MEIKADAAFHRIDALPRRSYNDEQLAELVRYYTERLRTPLGTQVLRPVQAQALYEISLCGGLFAPIGCGEGKTLISLLSAMVVPCTKFLLVVPASLKRKTELELPDISTHWQLPENMYIKSYTELSLESRAGELEELDPDFIFMDEAHRVKNQAAAVTRRIGRFIASKRGACRVGASSGTILTNDLDDLLHIANWTLREKSPWPYESEAAFIWKSATRQPKGYSFGGFNEVHVSPGPMAQWPLDLEGGQPVDERDFVRRAVKRRALDSFGVVASSKGETYGGNIIIEPVPLKTPANLDAFYKKLRTEWTTPNGWMLASPMQLWAKARELALGFHYSWDPFAPRHWLAARSDYAKLVRQAIEDSDARAPLDSERQVRTMLEQTEERSALRDAWEHWLEVEPTFTPNKIIIWHDTTALDACTAWAAKQPGIVWVEHREFGEELARRTGMSFYNNDAEDATGRHIMRHPPGESLIASVKACEEGQNLQAWHRNLITAPRGRSQEQLFARTHRPGQLKDDVFFDLLLSCREHLEAVPRAIEHAQQIVATIPNATQKILRADVSSWPDFGPSGWAYAQNSGKPLTLAALLMEE